MRSVLLVAVYFLLMACAGPGRHYEPGQFFSTTPNDPCQRVEMTSAGALQWLNASVGKTNGIPKRARAIYDLSSADPVALSSVSIRLPSDAGSVSCQATVVFEDNTADAGVLSVSNPGDYAPIQVQWISDAEIASNLADNDRRVPTPLFTPDLKTVRVQRCVGRAVARGIGEDFAWQLWAKCADPNYHEVH
ncbi:MAG: hypothetical protein WDN01_12065 [Rhizomicrobium sp.]